jgi:fringe protein
MSIALFFMLFLYFPFFQSFWCHFDDDSFVILPNLHLKLQQFSSNSDLYLGRASTSGPISFVTTRNNDEKANDPVLSQKFWFGTGGAGICLSRSTLLKMQAFIMGNHFETICAQLGLPDDVTLGFVLSEFAWIRGDGMDG